MQNVGQQCLNYVSRKVRISVLFAKKNFQFKNNRFSERFFGKES